MVKRLIIGLIIWGFVLFILNQAWAEIPRQPSEVYVEEKQLLVKKRLTNGRLGQPKPYIVKGITWSPATRSPEVGPNPLKPGWSVQYGFFFDWPGRNPSGREVFLYWLKSQYPRYYLIDIPLMKRMNVNTVRVYDDFGTDPLVYTEILDEFYYNDIMVIMNLVVSKADIESETYLKIVECYKNHPAILMWSLGNEWNFEYNKYWGYQTVARGARATNRVAQKVKAIDPMHPVSSCLGDRFNDPEPSNTVAWIVENCPDVDLWGINVYRGKSFWDLFTQWQEAGSKPFYISEFGTDSFKTKDFTQVDAYRADNCRGEEDQNMQADFIIQLWDEIVKHLSAFNPASFCLGGTVYTFNDHLWKVGSYHVGLDGLIDYSDPNEARSFLNYNSEGFFIPDSHPDNVANEEYFGAVDADRNPKMLFWKLKDYYSKLHLDY